MTEERWNHIIEAHPELKESKEYLMKTVRTPDNIFYNEFTNQYIFIKEFDTFITDNLLIYIKKLNGEGFIITCHPISSKRISRKLKKWKKLNP